MSTSEDLDRTLASSSRPVDVDDTRLTLVDEADRYELRRTLGKGGMGKIDLVYDRRIGRELAVKQIRKDALEQAGVRTRFVREARVQGQLEHPAVVPVYDLGLVSGVPYFTMRRILGLTLEEAIKLSAGNDPQAAEKFSRRRLLTAFVSLCLAIDYAHSRGVLHRDLKPSNVMLGDFGEVYLLDWGIAKVETSAYEPKTDPGETSLASTALGHAMGTLGYMAPEQLRGEHDEVGPRADVYALGALLFEILAREPLHPRSSKEVLQASTLNGTDARPSSRAGGRATPPELDEVCVRATALEADERYASARELATAVERYLDGDRDLERRRELAREHLAQAKALATQVHDRAQGPQDQVADRTEALRLLGLALILDPTEPESMRTLVQMLNEVPSKLPKDFERELAESAEKGRRSISTVGALVYLFGLVLLGGVSLLLQVRSWPWLSAMLLSVVGSAVASALFRKRRMRVGPPPPLFIPGVVVVAASTALFGPLLEAPMFAMLNIVAWSLHAEGLWRKVGVGCSLAAWLGPWVLELSGVLSPTYTVVNGDILIHGRMLAFHTFTPQLVLALLGVAVLVAASRMVGKFRDLRYQAELQRGWTAWQLRHLVPER